MSGTEVILQVFLWISEVFYSSFSLYEVTITDALVTLQNTTFTPRATSDRVSIQLRYDDTMRFDWWEDVQEEFLTRVIPDIRQSVSFSRKAWDWHQAWTKALLVIHADWWSAALRERCESRESRVHAMIIMRLTVKQWHCV